MDSVSADADARDDSLKFVALLLLGSRMAFADGGAVLLAKQAGPYLLTLFGSPSPLRAGRADLSVLVQKAEDKSNVLDAKVALHLTKTEEGRIVEFTVPATHDTATNKLLYAASLNVPSAGEWRIRADVRANGSEAWIESAIRVLEPEPPVLTYWPYFLVVPAVVFLFSVNQWLKRRRSVPHPRARA